MSGMLVVEHEFTLPLGYVDADGTLHRRGTMRLATAADEILPMRDPRVQALPAYLIVILLSRVVLRLGTLPAVNPGVIEGLFSADLSHLQELYNRINALTPRTVTATCPSCRSEVVAEVPPPGESSATPATGSTGRSPSSDAVSTGPTAN
ncbi:phage tail assembly protein [Pseudonocardia endophytica]|uniref:Uncharacterized protein n=1 Tax=Pseudonocardia endophytica TaxID=401976 RepID=A0A4R1HP18_PSEEN|nr:phage tail assembly protein [Pseudonocardia endophytica]TCK22873.1 hypothetical protein EV378_6884 [Pseudonocardia endophytica]